MSSHTLVQIGPEKATTYTISRTDDSNYYYCSRWYYHFFKKSLPYIGRFSFYRNLTVNTEEMFQDKINSDSLLQKKSLLPLSVRYIDSYGNYYIERPPFKLKIDYKNARAALSGPIINDIEIWIPWTLMVIPASFAMNYDPSGILIYYSSKPLNSLNDKYLHSLLPNTYAGGGICWSSSFQKILSMDQTRFSLQSFDATYWHSMIMNDYMMGGWNNDLNSQALYAVTPHAAVSSYSYFSTAYDYPASLVTSKQIDPSKAEEYLLSKYPNLHRYIHMEKYPDLAQKVYGLLVNKFGISSQRALSLVDYTTPFVPKTRARRRTSSDDRNGLTYSKLFSFLSFCTLSETLDFYSDITSYINDVYPRTASLVNSVDRFKDILANYKREEVNRFSSSDLPLALPFTSLTNSDPDRMAEYSSSYKSLSVYCAVENISSDKAQNLYNSSRSNTIYDLFDMFKVNINDFITLAESHMSESDSNSIFLKFDFDKKELSLVDKTYYQNLVSEIAKDIQEKISNIQNNKSKKRQDYSYLTYIDTEEKILKSLSI